jgi:hypothetical protein
MRERWQQRGRLLFDEEKMAVASAQNDVKHVYLA